MNAAAGLTIRRAGRFRGVEPDVPAIAATCPVCRFRGNAAPSVHGAVTAAADRRGGGSTSVAYGRITAIRVPPSGPSKGNGSEIEESPSRPHGAQCGGLRRSGDHGPGSGGTPGRHRHTDQTRGGDLPGERVVRPLLRHLSRRRQHVGPALRRRPEDAARRQPGRHAGRRRHREPADQQPERRRRRAPGEPAAARPGRHQRRPHLRPGPRLQRRAEGLRRRGDGQVRGQRRHGQRHQPAGPALPGLRRHELLRRQHGDGAVELRPALRHERQLLRDDVRPVLPRGDQPGLGRHRRRRQDDQRRRHRRRHRE